MKALGFTLTSFSVAAAMTYYTRDRVELGTGLDSRDLRIESRNPETIEWIDKVYSTEPKQYGVMRVNAVNRKLQQRCLSYPEVKLLGLLLKLHGSKKVVEVESGIGYTGAKIMSTIGDEVTSLPHFTSFQFTVL